MSASVRIESGIAAGTSYWIDRPVLRVGSDPNCEISLPSADLAPHALTLEFRSGVYRGYNRGADPVSLGSTTLQPGAAAVWNDGDTLTLPGNVRLVLAIDGDPRPCPRPDARTEDGFEDDRVDDSAATAAQTPEAVKQAKSKSLMQLAVIGLCIVGMGGLLLLNNSSSEATPENRASFDDIVKASLKQGGDAKIRVQKLQYAVAFLVRGDTETARTQFAALRDQLVREKNSWPEAERKVAQDILDYVESKLGEPE